MCHDDYAPLGAIVLSPRKYWAADDVAKDDADEDARTEAEAGAAAGAGAGAAGMGDEAAGPARKLTLLKMTLVEVSQIQTGTHPPTHAAKCFVYGDLVDATQRGG